MATARPSGNHIANSRLPPQRSSVRITSHGDWETLWLARNTGFGGQGGDRARARRRTRGHRRRALRPSMPPPVPRPAVAPLAAPAAPNAPGPIPRPRDGSRSTRRGEECERGPGAGRPAQGWDVMGRTGQQRAALAPRAPGPREAAVEHVLPGAETRRETRVARHHQRQPPRPAQARQPIGVAAIAQDNPGAARQSRHRRERFGQASASVKSHSTGMRPWRRALTARAKSRSLRSMSHTQTDAVAACLARVRTRIADAAIRAHRRPEELPWSPSPRPSPPRRWRRAAGRTDDIWRKPRPGGRGQVSGLAGDGTRDLAASHRRLADQQGARGRPDRRRDPDARPAAPRRRARRGDGSGRPPPAPAGRGQYRRRAAEIRHPPRRGGRVHRQPARTASGRTWSG